MNIVSVEFLLFFITFILLYNASSSAAWKNLVTVAANLLFLASFANSVVSVVPILAFLVYCYVAIEIVRRGVSASIFAVIMILTLAVFVVLKRYSFVPDVAQLSFPYIVIGLSYILFRVLHVLVDVRSGDISKPIPLLAYLNYTTNFLTLISGPIQRFQDFETHTQRATTALTDDSVQSALGRIVTGFLKVAVISAIANYFYLDQAAGVLAEAPGEFTTNLPVSYAAAAVAYTLYLYFNFSGYMDIVIGIGRLVGQDLPENFDRPFSSRNILEFWGRWHMTLSNWFKLYLFNPLLRLLMVRVTNPAFTPYLGVVAFFVTFLIMGIWHGPTAIFVVYGIIMGAGVSLNKLWQVVMTKRLGKKRYKALSDNRFYQYLCVGVTFSFFAMAVTCLWVDLAQFTSIMTRLGPLGVGAVFGMIALGAAVFISALEAAEKSLRPVFEKASSFSTNMLMHSFRLAAGVLMIVSVTSFFHKAPEFVYRAF